MKIAILSDIHGNIDALNEVLKIIEKENIKTIFSLGDQLGYYYDAEQVYRELRNRNSYIINGNHERIFLDYLNYEDLAIDEKYGICFKYYKNNFNFELINYIKKLPKFLNVKINNINFSLFHGSSFDEDFYVYPSENRKILDRFSKSDSDIIFFGHSHYPFMFNAGNKTVINVGSVGQSRVVGGIANWGVFDTTNMVFVPKSTPYNVKNVIQKIKEIDKGKYLETILKRNNMHYE